MTALDEAGRAIVTAKDGLTKDEWKTFASGADRIAQRGARDGDGTADGVSSPLRGVCGGRRKRLRCCSI